MSSIADPWSLIRSRLPDTVRLFFGVTNAGTRLKYSLMAFIAAALLLSACFEKDVQGAGGPTGRNSAENAKPTISGSPSTSIRVGEQYTFTPNASDRDGDALIFSIANPPSWATFDAATGRLEGTPLDAHAGIDGNIRIAVSDGMAKSALGVFSITVNQGALGSATLSWLPPTENADGTVLTDLAGYRIYYGRRADMLDQVVTVSNPGLTRYVIENLSPATWYFSMSSVNSGGVESARSGTASKTVG